MIKVKEKIILDKEHQKIINTLHTKIENLERDNKEMANVEKQHKYMNGELYKEIDKLKKENGHLKKENEVIREGNDYLGIYSNTLIDEVKKLSDDMTGAVTSGSALVKKNHRNIMFMTSIQGLIRYTQRITAIYNKIKKN
jgi:phosphoenolpyruvate carboxylase